MKVDHIRNEDGWKRAGNPTKWTQITHFTLKGNLEEIVRSRERQWKSNRSIEARLRGVACKTRQRALERNRSSSESNQGINGNIEQRGDQGSRLLRQSWTQDASHSALTRKRGLRDTYRDDAEGRGRVASGGLGVSWDAQKKVAGKELSGTSETERTKDCSVSKGYQGDSSQRAEDAQISVKLDSVVGVQRECWECGEASHPSQQGSASSDSGGKELYEWESDDQQSGREEEVRGEEASCSRRRASLHGREEILIELSTKRANAGCDWDGWVP